MTPKVGHESWIRLRLEARGTGEGSCPHPLGPNPLGGLNNLSGDQEEAPITWAQ